MSPPRASGPRYVRARATTVPMTPGPRCAPITAPELGDLDLAARPGSASRSWSATASARSAAARWCTARSTGASPAARDGQLHQPGHGACDDVRTFSSGDDLPLDHLQQRLHRQRRREQRRGGADAAAAAQVLERVDVEHRPGARRPSSVGRALHLARRCRRRGARPGRREHGEAEAHRGRARVDDAHHPVREVLRGERRRLPRARQRRRQVHRHDPVRAAVEHLLVRARRTRPASGATCAPRPSRAARA